MTDTATVRQVIRFLGWLAVILCLGVIMLAFRIVDGGKITPEQVGVLTPLVGLAGTALGAIGALLVSVHSVSPPPTPEQAGSDLPVDETGAGELRTVLLYAAGAFLGLVAFYLVAGHTTAF